MKHQGRPRSQAKCRQSLGGYRQQSDIELVEKLAWNREGGTISTCMSPTPQAQPQVQEQKRGEAGWGSAKPTLLFPWSGGTNWSDTSVILVTQSDSGLSRYYHGVSCVIYLRGRASLPCWAVGSFILQFQPLTGAA